MASDSGVKPLERSRANMDKICMIALALLISLSFMLTALAGQHDHACAQRSIIGPENLPITASDCILNLNATTDLTLVVPLTASRFGVPLTFKNLPGSHTQTVTATAPDKLEGQSTILLPPGASITLVPYNDGVNDALGYAIDH